MSTHVKDTIMLYCHETLLFHCITFSLFTVYSVRVLFTDIAFVSPVMFIAWTFVLRTFFYSHSHSHSSLGWKWNIIEAHFFKYTINKRKRIWAHLLIRAKFVVFRRQFSLPSFHSLCIILLEYLFIFTNKILGSSAFSINGKSEACNKKVLCRNRIKYSPRLD